MSLYPTKVTEAFLVVKEEGSGENWRLKLMTQTDTKEEALKRASGGVLLDEGEYFVIPVYRTESDWYKEPEEFKGVVSRGELPNPLPSPQADGDPAE
jgi:predicted RNase H-like HicB family nuclease